MLSGERSIFLYQFLAVATAYVDKSPERAVTVAARRTVAQLAGQSSADRALAQAATRFASGSDALARAVRERQDAIRLRDDLDKAIPGRGIANCRASATPIASRRCAINSRDLINGSD